MELYLNVAEFGPGVYGAEAVSRRYFGYVETIKRRMAKAEFLTKLLEAPSLIARAA